MKGEGRVRGRVEEEEEVGEQRRMLEVLRHERVDLETEVRRLRLATEEAQLQLRCAV